MLYLFFQFLLRWDTDSFWMNFECRTRDLKGLDLASSIRLAHEHSFKCPRFHICSLSWSLLENIICGFCWCPSLKQQRYQGSVANLLKEFWNWIMHLCTVADLCSVEAQNGYTSSITGFFLTCLLESLYILKILRLCAYVWRKLAHLVL